MTDNPCIFIVEDSAEQCNMLARQLESFGFSCVFAGTCAEGLRRVAESKFPCALIDLGLPDGSGADLLPAFKECAPHMVPIVLTGYDTTKSVIATMRSGAFDYLTKPVDFDVLRATILRAMSHHNAIRERDELLNTLFEEREQLRAKIEAATDDIRQYARTCEASNERVSALLRLTQVSAGLLYTDAGLLGRVFDVVSRYVPLRCLALCSDTEQIFLAVYQTGDGEVSTVVLDDDDMDTGMDSLLAAADPELLVRSHVGRHTDFDTSQARAFVFPQVFWNRRVCTVGLFVALDFEGSETEREFLSTCAHFVASEWQQARLLQHATQRASVGNIALELSRSFLQSLTAIGTATDVLKECVDSDEALEGLGIIADNVELLRSQTRAFQNLSSEQMDSLETVRLAKYVDQALGMVSVAIHKRGVHIVKDYQSDGECVMVNGTALSRTFLNIISRAIREVEYGSDVILRLYDSDESHIVFEVSLEGLRRGETRSSPVLPDVMERNPSFLLEQRTVHGCGGTLTFANDDHGRSIFRVTLPRNVDSTDASSGTSA